MADQLIRATAAEGGIRAVGVITTGLTQEARQRHKLSYVASVALGRTMTAGLLLASSMKPRQSRVNITVRGDGPLGSIHVDAGLDGTVRGYVENPDVELPLTPKGKLNVGGAVGNNGYFQVRRDEGYDPAYISTVELVSGEIGEDTTHYLLTSEQTPSALMLGEFVNKDGIVVSGGVLFQIIPKPGTGPQEPPTPEAQMTALSGFSMPLASGRSLAEIFDQLLEDREDKALVYTLESRIAALSSLASQLRAGKTLQEIFEELLGDMGLQIVPEIQQVRFHCGCSFGRVLGALKILGEAELQDMIEKDDGAEATCHFCGRVYKASSAHLAELIGDLRTQSRS